MSCSLIANLDVLRFTRVDACGKPIPGPHAYVTECASSVALNVNIDTPDDIIYRAANGTLCGVKRGCPTLLGYDAEINVYQVSPEMIDVLTGNPQVVDAAAAPIGWDDCTIQCNSGFALEFWSELIGENCTTTGAQKYLYVLLPWISNAYLNDIEIGSEQVTFQILGNTRAGGQWGVGPWNVINGAGDVPGPLLTPLGATCHRRMMITTVAPPVPLATCTYVTVPTPAP